MKWMNTLLLCTTLSLLMVSCHSEGQEPKLNKENRAKPEAPSLVKIFVRDDANDLVQESKVILEYQANNTADTTTFVDSTWTDENGVAVFNLRSFHLQKEGPFYFRVSAFAEASQAKGMVKSIKGNTSAETLFLEDNSN